MADYKVTDTELTSIANAIRTKGGTQAQLEFPTGFVSAVQAIPTGGGVIVPLSATQNGVYTPPSGTDGYAPVTVNVSGGGGGITVYSAEGDPSSSLGSVGDIYMKEIGEIIAIPTLDTYITNDYEVTFSGGSEFEDYKAYKAFRDNIGAGKSGSGDFSIVVHFLKGPIVPVGIKSVRYFNVPGGYLASNRFQIFGSNDGQQWTQLLDDSTSPSVDEEYYNEIVNTTPYNYISFTLSGFGYPGIKSIKLYADSQNDTVYDDVFYKTSSGWKHIIEDLLKSETILN